MDGRGPKKELSSKVCPRAPDSTFLRPHTKYKEYNTRRWLLTHRHLKVACSRFDIRFYCLDPRGSGQRAKYELSELHLTVANNVEAKILKVGCGRFEIRSSCLSRPQRTFSMDGMKWALAHRITAYHVRLTHFGLQTKLANYCPFLPSCWWGVRDIGVQTRRWWLLKLPH